jgi:hypothetical protein
MKLGRQVSLSSERILNEMLPAKVAIHFKVYEKYEKNRKGDFLIYKNIVNVIQQVFWLVRLVIGYNDRDGWFKTERGKPG